MNVWVGALVGVSGHPCRGGSAFSVPGLGDAFFPVAPSSTPYTPLERKAAESTDEETLAEEWALGQPVSQTRTTAIVEVKGAVDVVLTPLVAEALDRCALCLWRLLLFQEERLCRDD